jgi:4-amino-4-deoxy-L-arabinose transferase-like glycosyltransferase
LPSATALWQALWRLRVPMFLLILALAYFAYVANLQNNPPGFYVDESSIAYNAYTISESGSDEYGIDWPIYFRAFGEYKNPVYIYLLAALFKVTGPNILVARLLSSTLGFAAALLLALLVFRITTSFLIACFSGFTALVTPWLFEISRLVFEVALLPLALLLFLLALQRVKDKQVWGLFDSLAVAASLGLLTYTYSICRLLEPLLAVGLAGFINRERWKSIGQTWGLYALTLIPMIWFAAQNPQALTTHFDEVSYLNTDGNLTHKVLRFVAHYITNLNLWEWLVVGDQRVRHHVEGTGSLLFVPLLIALTGLVIVVIHYRSDPWWRFVFYGLVVSVIPASLTNDDFHALRLAPFPVFLLLFMAPALQWMRSHGNPLWRWGVILLVCLTLLQAAMFQRHFHRQGVGRKQAFDHDYPAVFKIVVANSDEPIYLPDTSYIHAYWYGTLAGVNRSRFNRQTDEEGFPDGAMIIRLRKNVQEHVGQVIGEQGRFIAYRMTCQ